MRPLSFQGLCQQIEDDTKVNFKIFDPFITFQCQKITKENERISTNSVFRKLLNFDEQQPQKISELDQIELVSPTNQVTLQDKNVNKILLKKYKGKGNNKKRKQQFPIFQNEPYSFNFDSHYCYKQTPMFKCILQTPLKVFYKKYQHKIQQLLISNKMEPKFQIINEQINPCLFVQKPASFFVGVGLSYQNNNNIYQSLYLYNLACYIEPFNVRLWDDFISYTKKIGMWKKAFVLSKTAFLFRPCSLFAEQYLLCGDKAECQCMSQEVYLALQNTLKNTIKQSFNLPSIKSKNRKAERGIRLLYKYCTLLNFKPQLQRVFYQWQDAYKLSAIFNNQLEQQKIQFKNRILDLKYFMLIYNQSCALIMGYFYQQRYLVFRKIH